MKGATERLRPVLMTATVATLGHAAGGHPHRRRQRRAARHRDRGGRRTRDLHHADAVRPALDVPRHRALGRAAPRPGAVGPMMLSAAQQRVVAAAVALRARRLRRRAELQAARRRRPIRLWQRRRRPARPMRPRGRPATRSASSPAWIFPAEWWTLVPVAAARPAGRAGAQGQPRRRRRAGGAAARRTSCISRSGPASFPTCREASAADRSEYPGGHADRTRDHGIELDLQSLHGAAHPELHARRVRRHAARGRDGQGAGAEHPLPARGHLPDLEQQCGRDGHQEASLRGPDQERPSGCSSCSIS